jgi:3-deoxy-manno-octulosonate cytidylyltransferase (CMP-KDO synthetase)
MIMWVYECAVASGAFDKVVVATDHDAIFSAVKKAHGDVVMTSPDHPRGTDRVFEVVRKVKCDFVVNLQGDEPNVPKEILTGFSSEVKKLNDNSLLTIASHATIVESNNPNVVKVVLDRFQNALYFSRSRIPYDRDAIGAKLYKHKGIYGFSSESLAKFCSFPQGELEKAESLEQLRALEYGMKIRCLVRDFDSIGIDTQDDLELFRRIVANGHCKY